MYLRCSIDKPKGDPFLLFFGVYVIAAGDFLLEVIMDHTGVVLHLQLSHAWDTQQQVLVIDVRLGAVRCQGLVVVPLCPVKIIQQGTLCVLQRRERRTTPS